MTGSAAAQGTSKRATLPFDQAGKPGRVSADSFRKLSLLLKKHDFVPPAIAPAIPAVAPVSAPVIALEPAPAEPPKLPLEAAAPVVVPDIAPVMIPDLVQVAVPPVEPPAEIIAIPEEPPVVVPEILATPQPEQAQIPPPAMAPPPAEIPPDPQSPPQAADLSLRKRRVIDPPSSPPVLSPHLAEMARPRVETPVIEQTPEQEAEASELARSLLDMMAKGSAAGQPQERALAADTLLRMLPRLPLKSRVTLASRLCLMDQPHHLLVAKLITDPEISVAGPLLEDCAPLTDEDLLRVVAEQDPAKRRMMARRRKISRTVTTALIETGDSSVLLTIARNAGAEITAEGFAMMERAARNRSELLAPLCIRADLPVHFAFSLFWLAPPELRRYLLTRFLTDSETLTKILKIARGTHGENADEKIQPDPQVVKLALAQAASGDIAGAALALAGMSALAPETVTHILEDRLGEPLMALLKAVSFPRSQVLGQVEALKGSLIDEARLPDDLQALFDSLSFNKARILLTYWDWSSLGTGPYALAQ